jgi:hypothetical protein
MMVNDISGNNTDETGKLTNEYVSNLRDGRPSETIRIEILDAYNEPHDCDYTGIVIDYSKIDNLSPGWGMMLIFQDNLNRHIGFNRWKRYVSANFWNYVTTPINFTITLFTAISAGQTGTGSGFLSNTQLFSILFASFILSTINTFFKLKDKSEISYGLAKTYDKFGATFEQIYYSNIKNQGDVEQRLNKYRKLHEEINYYMTNEEFESVDYIADLLFVCFRRICYCFIKNNLKQVNADDSFWYLDGVKTTQTKELMLNTEKLFVYDFTKIKSKSNFFGLFSDLQNKHGNNGKGKKRKQTNSSKIDKDDVEDDEDVGCFINENNKRCCKRVNKWCDYYLMKHIRQGYNTICCCECCDIKDNNGHEGVNIETGNHKDNVPASITELSDNNNNK